MLAASIYRKSTMILPLFSLNQKVALVTGGGQGLGLEIAKVLAGAGAFVLINGRKEENLNRAVSCITSIAV